jgi:hypothetical protein
VCACEQHGVFTRCHDCFFMCGFTGLFLGNAGVDMCMFGLNIGLYIGKEEIYPINDVSGS